ncbi:phenylacetic acid degradation operon negative regulatory protein PaaX [Fictibacillus aquaticus]|uniref:Phenylacetic acid degradation operon negative regulatory protein PaaX n=1 Tax=Fictibacillus aquaticus TaxID=2021314 RepID=A0A235FG21_9BACL|nr:phenylacetic acid degradation operon negative regulatory protein PaaX [Fictibacillus aquaticus]OYD59675.1 phenylacetic acid degradation operon negative regulatory protein PaaX [Fictibacillus aquaticus]
MQNSLNTRSMIFTLYGDYIRHYGSEIWIGSLIRFLEEFGHNEQAVRAAISRMSKQGWIESRKQGNKSYYFLTQRGQKRMDEAAKRIFKLQPEKWSGEWTMFTYTIPEEKRSIRDELRKELVWSGFGLLTNSFWISPGDQENQIQEVIEKYDIRSYVHYFTAQYKGPDESTRLVRECWNLEEINERYDEFIKKYSQKYVIDKNKIEKGEMTDGECFVERTKLVHEYRKFLFVDPGLPQELLPAEWLGDHAASLFSDYYKALAVPSNRFFESIYREGNELKKVSGYDVLNHPLMANNEQ